MTPEQERLFEQRILEIAQEHPEGMSEGAILDEMWLRGYITPEIWERLAFDGLVTNIYYILERKVLWTEVSPRQIRRQRRQSPRPPIVRTGVLCDREGRKLCTVSQDAAGEYFWPENIEDYMREVFEEYPGCPEDYKRPDRHGAY